MRSRARGARIDKRLGAGLDRGPKGAGPWQDGWPRQKGARKERRMGSMSLAHWLIVLVAVIAVFGTKKLRGAGKDLGEAVRGFKEAARGEEAKDPQEGRPRK